MLYWSVQLLSRLETRLTIRADSWQESGRPLEDSVSSPGSWHLSLKFNILKFQFHFFSQNLYFWWRFKFLSNLCILDLNFYLCTKFYFWRKLVFFDYFPKFVHKIYIFTKFYISDHHLYFWPIITFFTNLYSFYQYLYFWPNFLFLTNIFIFDQNFVKSSELNSNCSLKKV